MEFSYDRFNDELTVGGGGDDGLKHNFDLGNLIDTDEKNLPYTSENFMVRVKTGDYDGISLPWFKTADASLLFWEAQKEKDWVDLPIMLRVIKEQTSNPKTDWVVSERTVQVALGETSTNEDGHDRDQEHYNKNNNNHHADIDQTQVLLSIALNQSPNLRDQTRHNVSKWNFWSWISTSSRQRIEKVFYVWYGHDGLGTSPSLTFPLRLVVCRILVSSYQFADDWVFAYMRNPIIIFLSVLYVVFWVGVVYCLVVLACWSKRGRPNFWPWARRFGLTRYVVRYIRPTMIEGGKDEIDYEYEEDMEMERPRPEPRPLTSPWAFFTSSSPLDDLLVTYRVTRPFVQPIHLIRRRRTRDIEGGEEVTMATTSSLDVIKNDYIGDDEDVHQVGEKKIDITK